MPEASGQEVIVVVYDVVIVGGGAAGLSAALVLGRARRSVAVVDAGSPRNAPADQLHGFLSRDGMSPLELLSVGRAEVAGYGVELFEDRVVGVDFGFYVRLAGGATLKARRVLFATGLRDELPELPGVRERWGRDVHVCPYCHGWEVRDQPIGVIGTSALSVHHALLIRGWSDDVLYFPQSFEPSETEATQLAAVGVRLVAGTVAGVQVENDRVTGVRLESGEVVARSAVFLRPPFASPADPLLRALGCEFDETGFVRTDPSGRTTAWGVWAAGNVADQRAAVVTSAGDGFAAAVAINTDLLEEDIERAVLALTPA
ncbi:NAD(P)/FAD-dependent oxidoreductase [Tenggerimyces flavus]|uniref:NAD(P)/FAD-dependent oxidoreductase n=1 Tax=Tenggerimyces flavus TaxID=1708749 RepID=A0ABV7Y8P6_9ACTN|nr:NAD(P)/FAD-dependent oxidoreductase [Tenggerimyces flavus]MBM7783696.1 thioredoxin reductase [Tenggerimyces flavus]